MATLQELKDAIDAVLNLRATGQLLTLRRHVREKAYEVYVFALVSKAVTSVGGTTVLHGIISGANPTALWFRGGPGQIWSKAHDYSYLLCQLRNKVFEVHVSVSFEGNSGASHEIDVSILEHDHAAKARTGRLFPRTNKNLIGAVECKFYEGPPDVALGRTFVGLLSDCSTNRFEALAVNRTGTGLERFLSRGNSPENFTDLTPLDLMSERRFVGTLAQALRQWSNSR